MAKPIATPGTSSKDVLEAQKLLSKVSKNILVRENGEFDDLTVAGIKTFQKECGVAQTGILDEPLMKLLRSAASLGGAPKYQITLNGKTYLLTDQNYKDLIETVKKDFRKPMIQLKGAVEEARMLYNDMKKLNDDQYIVSFFVNAVNRSSLPNESIIRNAEALTGGAEKALNNGDFKVFGNMFLKAQTAANEARKAMKDYCSGVIDGAGSIVTGLEFVEAASFTTVGILAAPVAASYGLGAVAAGVVAGAGTNAVESIAGEVGKGIAGSSEGFGKATLNVLKDTAIGAAVGRLTAGKMGEQIIQKIGPMIASKLTGQFFQRASQKAVVQWIGAYFRANGANILEGIITDVMKANKSNASGLTVDAFLGIVAKQVVTAGVFSKFSKLGDVSSKALMSRLPSKVVKDLMSSLGAKATEKELDAIFAKAIEEFGKEGGGKVYDTILGSLSGKETPEAVDKMILDEYATNRKLLDAIRDEVEKQAKKRK